MTIDTELGDFYRRVGFGDVVGARPRTVRVYTGCMLVPLPNIETRRRYLKYHDLHHLITGYSVGRIGEGEVSAWELGAGSMLASPMLGLMNLIALSTGMFLEPRRMWRAFLRGTTSRHLYRRRTRAEVDAGRWSDVAALRGWALAAHPAVRFRPLRAVEFAAYAGTAVLVHALLVIPAIIARFASDTLLGMSVFEAVKPRRRTDLY